MTRKKVRPIPTDEELVRDFTGQKFRNFVVSNWPGQMRPRRADVERYVLATLGDARVYIRDAVRPAHEESESQVEARSQEVSISHWGVFRVRVYFPERPLMSPIREAAVNFAMNHQLTFYQVTGVVPPSTASRFHSAAFLTILRECLRLLRAPIDHIALINTLQARSNTMTDEKGQPRRKRKSSKAVPE